MSGGASAAALFAETRDRGAMAGVDPRVRLVLALAFALAMPLVQTPAALAAAVLVAVCIAAVFRLDVRSALKRLAAAEMFLLALLASLPFAVPGTPVFEVFGLEASAEGFARAGVLAVRISAALLVVAALVGGLGGQRLAAAMTGIGLPARLSTLLLMTLRYTATLADEYRRLRTAMRVRGFRAGTNRHSWRSLGYLVGMLIVRSLDRGQRVQEAMLCRGYAGRFPSTDLGRPGRRDLAVLAGGLAAIGLVLLTQVLA